MVIVVVNSDGHFDQYVIFTSDGQIKLRESFAVFSDPTRWSSLFIEGLKARPKANREHHLVGSKYTAHRSLSFICPSLVSTMDMVFKDIAYIVFFPQSKHFVTDTDELRRGHACPCMDRFMVPDNQGKYCIGFWFCLDHSFNRVVVNPITTTVLHGKTE